MKSKTMKVPFEIILRNKKTREEIKVGNLSVPIKVNVDKKLLYQIMKKNIKKEFKDDSNWKADVGTKGF